MPFCKNCGRELQEGETCNCKQNSESEKVENDTSVQVVEQPDTSAPVKEAGSFDFMGLLKAFLARVIGIMPNKTYNEIKSAAQDKSFVWVIVALVEMIFGSLSFTVCIRRAIYKIIVEPFSFLDIKYSDFIKEAPDMGLGFFALFFKSMLVILILLATLTLATWLFTLVLKKNTDIMCILNTITTMILPFTIILLICFIVVFVIPKLALCLLAIDLLLLVILNYIAVKELCGYDDSAIWTYVLYMIIVDVINFLAIGKILLPILAKALHL